MKHRQIIPVTSSKTSLLYFFLRTLINSQYKIRFLDTTFKLVSHIQIISLLISFPYEVLPANNTDSFGQFTQFIVDYLCFRNVFKFNNKSALNRWIWVITIMYTIFLLLLTIVLLFHYFKQKHLSPLFLKIWTNTGTFHYSFAFLLVYQLALSYMNSFHMNNVILFSRKDTNGFLVLAIIMTIVIIFYAVIFSRFLYDSVNNESIYLCTRKNTHELLMLSLKIIDPPMSIFMSYYSYFKWIRIVIMMLITALHLRLHYVRIPCYSFKAMRIYSRLSFLEMGITLVNLLLLVLQAAQGLYSLSIAYFISISVIFLIKLSDLVLQSQIKIHGSKSVQRINHINHFNWKLFALEYIIETGFDTSSFMKHRREHSNHYLFYGEILNHQKTCKKSKCGCGLIIARIKPVASTPSVAVTTTTPTPEVDAAKEKQLLYELRVELLKDLYVEAINKMPAVIELKVSLANLVTTGQTKMYIQAINLLHKINLEHANIEKRMWTTLLLERIENNMRMGHDSSISVKEIIDHQALSEKLLDAIKSNISKFLRFWEDFKSPDPSLRKLYLSSIQINKEADKIEQIWVQLVTEFTKSSYQDHLLYGLFQSLVRSAPHSAEKTLQKYFSFANVYDPERARESYVTADNIHESSNIFVCISMKREKLGIVTFITANVEEALQYKQNEVLDKDVRILMPPFYKQRHRKILIAHTEKNKNAAFNKNRQVFASKKSGFVAPYTLYITMFPYFQEQLSYFGVLRPVQTFDEFILVLDNGTIDGFSEGIGKLLGVKPEMKRKYQLGDVSSQLAKIHKYLLQFVVVDGQHLRAFKSKRSNLKTLGYIGSTSTAVIHSATKGFSPQYSLKQSHTINSQNREGEADYESSERRPMYRKATSLMDINDLSKLYDIFLSSGVNIRFHRAIDNRSASIITNTSEFAFSTTIYEECVLGNHMRVFRLQASTGEAVSFDEEDENDEEGINLKRRPTNMTSDASPRYAPMNTDGVMTASINQRDENVPPDTVKIEDEEEIAVKKPANSMRLTRERSEPRIPRFTSDVQLPRLDSSKQLKVIKISLPKRGSVRDLLKKHEDQSTERLTVSKNNEEENITTRKRRESTISIFNPQMREALHQINLANAIKEDKTKVIESQQSKELEAKNRQAGFNNLKVFLKEHKIFMNNNDGEDVHDRASIGSRIKQNKVNVKLEQAIYLSETDPALKILHYVMLTLSLVSIVLLVICKLMLSYELTRVESNVDVLKLSYDRMNYIVEVNRRARVINFLQRGLASGVRHTADYATTNQQALLESSSTLLTLNNQLRTSIYEISSQEGFFTPILVVETNPSTPSRAENTFDLGTEIANAGLDVYNLLPNKPSVTDQNLNFILNNTMNDILVEGTEACTVFLNSSLNDSILVKTAIQSSIGIIGLLSIIICIVVSRMELKFKREKVHFLETLLMIKDHEIDQWLRIVKSFHNTLKEGKRGNRFIEYIMNDHKSYNSVKSSIVKKNQERTSKGRRAQFKGISMPTVYNLIIIFILMVLFTLAFVGMSQIFMTNYQALYSTGTRVGTTGDYLFDFGVLFNGLYEYIAENGQTTMMDQPIGQSWETMYTKLTGFGYYASVFNQEKTVYGPELSYLLAGDLCLELFPTYSCRSDNSGIASKGILAMSSYMLNLMRGLKDFFDSSNRTVLFQELALSADDLISLEDIYYNYAKASFQELVKVLMNDFTRNVVNCRKEVLVFVVCISIGSFVLMKVVWSFLEKRMKDERRNYRNMLRLVPVSVIISNRYVKQYLFTHSKKILDLVKNKLQ